MAKSYLSDYSPTPASNTDIDGVDSTGATGRVKDGDNYTRSVMSHLAKFYDDLGAVNTVGGTATAITVTAAEGWTAYGSSANQIDTGTILAIKTGWAAAGATTISVNSLGAKAVRRQGDSAIVAGDWLANSVTLLRYDTAYNGSAGAWVLLNAGYGRERLTTNRTYYVRADGNDSNDGLADTSGGAFLTVQKAIDVVADTLDLAGYNVTISCGSGTFAAISLRTLVGRGRATISGNSSAINVASGDNVSASNVLGDWKITGFSFQNTGSGNQVVARNATIALGNNTYNYGNTGVHITAADGGVITVEDGYTLAGNCAAHWQVLNGGTLRCEGITITNTSGLIFTTAFAFCASGGNMLVGANTFATTTATAVRFQVVQNGVIRTYGAGASYLPGNSAGVTATGGQYV